MNTQAGIRHVLPSIRVPTLVLHRTGDRDMNVAEGRYIAARIPGARFVELPGEDHLPFSGDADAFLNEVEEFLTGERHGPEPDRVLATILLANSVASMERAATIGDRRWRTVLESYRTMVRAEIDRCRDACSIPLATEFSPRLMARPGQFAAPAPSGKAHVR